MFALPGLFAMACSSSDTSNVSADQGGETIATVGTEVEQHMENIRRKGGFGRT